MKNKILFSLMLGIFLISLVSANGFLIELKPHYYSNSKEILVYNNGTSFDGISFEVIGKNLGQSNRVVNLSIVKLSPDIDFGFINTKEILISNQQKTLWTSRIIDILNFNNSEINFIRVGVSGTNEVTSQTFYTEGQYALILNNIESNPNKSSRLVKNFGELIWEGNWELGILTLAGIIIILGIVWWRYDISKKLNKWKTKTKYEK